ncbi:MAG: sulfite exporter TauE/SafE family protein [Verrucomicrobia bacterium]|nr:sulfite exporter TauE/SafE family protein [Verrucomicrobiota bacterium]
MDSMWLGAATALWLGILTSISPCPLATNVAAISFIGRRVGSARHVLLTGALYTLGRALAYLALAAVLVASLLSAPGVSHWLQKYMNKLLGPILVLVGMVLLDLVPLTLSGGGVSERMQRRVERLGIWGAGLLGIVFALTFCPVSAALFFGSLVPLAVKWESSVLLPALYGIGTALPVIAFAILIALGTQQVGKVFNATKQFERWAQWLTGGLFLAIGIYFSLAYIFEAF